LGGGGGGGGRRGPGGEEKLFQWLCALGMNPPRPAVAGGPVGTAARGCFASVLQVLKRSFSTTARRGGTGAGGEEELFQRLDALGMNPPQPVLGSGPVGSAVLGCLAALLPLLKDPLPEPSAGEDRRVAGRRQSSTRDAHELREGPSRPFGGGGGVSAAGRGYLAAVLRGGRVAGGGHDSRQSPNPRGPRALSQTAGVPIIMGCVSREPPPESLFPIPIPESLIPEP
jgi:hypothetical protein